MKRSLLVTLSLIFSSLSFALSQQPTPRQQQGAPDEDEVVRISTNLVQVDAVVTDGKDRQVTDLDDSDFEILEDGKPQQIINFSYVRLGTTEPLKSSDAAGRKEKSLIPPPLAGIRPEQVRRTLALVVDDLGLSFESMVFVRQALKKFVDEQMQPNDLAAVVRTSAGAGSLQQFTTDRRRLYAAIDQVRWYPFGRSGVSSFKPIDLDPVERLKDRAEKSLGGRVSLNPDYSGSNSDIENLRQDTFSIGTLGAIKYVVQGMRELPGRKSVLLLSDGLKIFNPAKRTENSNGSAKSGRQGRDQDVSGVAESLRRLTDIANRASVVIYTMDARGLQTLGLNAVDDTRDLLDENDSPQRVLGRVAERKDELFASQDGLNYLARQTGGFFIHDTNDITGGIRKVIDDQKGYYLIGYRPDQSTFDVATGARQFHHLTVRVKRPGLRVRTRTGFFGITDAQLRSMPRTGSQQLLAALESPFSSGDLRLRLTSLFGDDPESGSFMRNLVHIDGRDLSFTDEPNGWHKVTFDILAVTFGERGEAVEKYGRTETMRVSDSAYGQARENGLIYTLNVPVKRPGAYQMRIAVRDVSSNRVGSANQFIEVPDLSKSRLALSGIAVSGFDPRKGVSLSAGPAEGATTIRISADSAAKEPDQPDPLANPAVRRIRPGMVLQYAYLIYNARMEEKTRVPRLLTQVRLFREGTLVYTGKVYPYEAGAQKDLRRLPVTGTLQLGSDAKPGEYHLQVIVTDQLAGEKQKTVTNWTDLEIIN